MLKEHAEKYVNSEFLHGEEHSLYHYNCAETLLNSCNDEFELGIDQKAMKMIVPFGGGFYSERACGVLTGGLAALGVMYAEDRPTDNKKVKEISQKWVKAFEEEFGSINCDYIKKHHRHETKKCGPVMIRGAELLQKVIEEEL
ncbi:MAG: C_GCAxxG_C_C family protein [Eubacteriaceae bacterium]|nr:C_GCAxxG_C_C family protein [Eubacteriaceae bacterium]